MKNTILISVIASLLAMSTASAATYPDTDNDSLSVFDPVITDHVYGYFLGGVAINDIDKQRDSITLSTIGYQHVS